MTYDVRNVTEFIRRAREELGGPELLRLVEFACRNAHGNSRMYSREVLFPEIHFIEDLESFVLAWFYLSTWERAAVLLDLAYVLRARVEAVGLEIARDARAEDVSE